MKPHCPINGDRAVTVSHRVGIPERATFSVAVLFIALLMATLPPGMAMADAPSAGSGGLRMRIASAQSAKLSYVKALYSIGHVVKSKSGGKIDTEVITNGRRGQESELLRAVIRGRLEGALISASVLSNALPAYRLLTTPLMFTTYGQVNNFPGSSLDYAMRRTGTSRNLKVLGYTSYGFYGVLGMSSNSSLKGMKVRVPVDGWITRLHRALSVKPVHTPSDDLERAISKGWVRGIAATPEILSQTSFPRRAKLFHNTRHLHGWSVFVVNRRWYNRLPSHLKKMVASISGGACEASRKAAQGKERQLLSSWGAKGAPSVKNSSPSSLASRFSSLVAKRLKKISWNIRTKDDLYGLWKSRNGG